MDQANGPEESPSITLTRDIGQNQLQRIWFSRPILRQQRRPSYPKLLQSLRAFAKGRFARPHNNNGRGE